MAIDITEDALVPDDSKIQSISAFAEELLNLQADIIELGAKAAVVTARYKDISEKLLPDAMISAGVEEFKLANGTKVSIKEDMSISVPKKNLPQVCGWLRENNHGDIIKNEVTVSISKGKGAEQQLAKITKLLDERGIAYDHTEAVHSGTLKALLKEQRGKGVELDLKLFGAYEWRKAEVKLPEYSAETF